MPRKNIQRKSITPSINYAIEVIVFEQEKQPWETMNWELHKLLAETIFDKEKEKKKKNIMLTLGIHG